VSRVRHPIPTGRVIPFLLNLWRILFGRRKRKQFLRISCKSPIDDPQKLFLIPPSFLYIHPVWYFQELKIWKKVFCGSFLFSTLMDLFEIRLYFFYRRRNWGTEIPDCVYYSRHIFIIGTIYSEPVKKLITLIAIYTSEGF